MAESNKTIYGWADNCRAMSGVLELPIFGAPYALIDFRVGSTTNSGGYPQFRPLSGEERKSISGNWRSPCSQEML